MTITDLIAALEDIRARHGDLLFCGASLHEHSASCEVIAIDEDSCELTPANGKPAAGFFLEG